MRHNPSIDDQDDQARSSPARALQAGGLGSRQDAAAPVTHMELMDAARANDLDLLRRYVQQGGNVDRIDKEGQTALRVALLRGNASFAIAALEAGADPAIQSPVSGASALHIAVGRRRTEILENLLNRADVAAFIDLPSKEGETALHIAAATCQPEFVRKLLTAGAERMSRSKGGFAPPVYRLVRRGDVEGANATMEAFLEHEPDPAAFLTSVVFRGRSLLHTAAGAGAPAMVELMLDRGAPVDVEERPPHVDCWTPFHAACAKGKVECVRLLAAHGADIHKRTRSGDSALTLALKFLKDEAAARTLSALIDLGLDPDAPEHEGAPRRLAQRIQEALRVLEAHAARRAMLAVAAGAPQSVRRSG